MRKLAQALVLLALCAVLAYPAFADPTCDSTSRATILAAMPACGSGCWSAGDCAKATGIGVLVCLACFHDLDSEGLAGVCGLPESNHWCRL